MIGLPVYSTVIPDRFLVPPCKYCMFTLQVTVRLTAKWLYERRLGKREVP